jgi:decaprenyl-phosphate phosphoribosyltransferase
MSLLSACRPRQWVKNVLVLAVPAAAGALDEGSVLLDTVLAFVAFTLVSCAAYLLNDVADLEADRRHPLKRSRPVAAGRVPVRTALGAGVVFVVVGLLVAAVASLELLGIVALYVALTAAYSRWLKHVPVFEIAVVAAGFFLRAVAGGVAADLYVSRWFLIVTASGSLFVTIGKRYAEMRGGGPDAGTRRVLAAYTQDYLRAMLSTSAGVLVLAYCLWAFEGSPGTEPSAWTALSAVPFVLGVMRYGLLVDQGHGEEPEEILFADRQLHLVGAAWLVLLGLGVLG